MKIVINSAELVGNDIWFVPYMTNKLVSLDIHSGDAQIRTEIEMLDPIDENIVLSIEKWNNSIFILPKLGQEIYEYNVVSNKLSVIKISEPSSNEKNNEIYSSLIAVEDKLYVLGYNCPKIVIINLRTHIVSSVEVFDNILSYENSKGIFGKQSFIYNGVLYIPFAAMDGWMELNIENNQFNKVILSDNNEGYSALIIKNNILYAAPRFEGSLLRYDLVNGKYEKKRVNNHPIRSFSAISDEDEIVLYKDEIPFNTNIQKWKDMFIKNENYYFVKVRHGYKIMLNTDGILEINSDNDYFLDINEVMKDTSLQKELNCQKLGSENLVIEGKILLLSDYIERLIY